MVLRLFYSILLINIIEERRPLVDFALNSVFDKVKYYRNETDKTPS